MMKIIQQQPVISLKNNWIEIFIDFWSSNDSHREKEICAFRQKVEVNWAIIEWFGAK